MNLQELTIEQASKDLSSKKYSATELVDAAIKQTTKLNEKINAFVSITKERALTAAENYRPSSSDALLNGIPTSLKDLYNWKGTKTTASSNMLKNYVSPYSSTVTQKLEDAGAAIIGKTNLDSFAHGSSTETSDFFTTKNPWNTTRLPGGSSGGAAAAVAAGMGLYAMGTETAGSIRQPSSWCGLTGLKPTYGRISRYGVIAMGSSLDCPGPICKSAADCAIVLEALAGKDTRDATTSPLKSEKYYSNLDQNAIKGLRVGVPKEYFPEKDVQPEIINKAQDALKQLEKLGAKLIDIDLLDPKYSIAVYTLICRSEVSSNLARYDGIRYGHESEEIVDEVLDQIAKNRAEGFCDETRRRIMTGTYALSSGYYDAYYKKAQKVRTLIRQDLDEAFKKVDVIIGPTTPSTALEIGSTKDNPLFGEIADVLIEASTLSGCPGLSVPVGFDLDGLPIGMNIFAPQFEEQLILNVGHAYQQVTDFHRQFPNLDKTLNP